MSAAPALFQPRLAQRRLLGACFHGLCLLITLVGVFVLFLLLALVFRIGWKYLTWALLTNEPSFLNPAEGGIRIALIGSVLLVLVAAVVAVPVGVGAAVYLEEYARKTRLNQLIQLNIANLAGVPSIVYGMLGLAIFVRWLRFDRSVLSGGLTLAILIVPVVIIASREALAAVPNSIRHAALALGATRWQMIRHHVLPAALPGILTGVILSVSRAIGEAAPLIVIGAAAFIMPGGGVDTASLFGWARWLREALLAAGFTALPIQIFDWSMETDPEFQDLAGSAIIVLLGTLLSMNALAVGIRAWQQGGKTR
ncbi:MAG: Phosphate transport system permease protein PstA [Phycisphaerae bacterium]|nr:Phosphate transport system permease protein PstA [Phycisphaerae bacterium]